MHSHTLINSLHIPNNTFSREMCSAVNSHSINCINLSLVLTQGARWAGFFSVRSQKISIREQKCPKLADSLELNHSMLQEISISSPLESRTEILPSEDSRISKGLMAPRFLHLS